MELDSEIVGSIDMADNITESFSWDWVVDNAIRSRSPSNSGASPVHSFRSKVNSAIRSRTPSNLGTSPSPLHSFASALNVNINTIAARLSLVEVSNATRYVAPQFFTLAQLQKATKKFSLHNKIRDDDYRGKLVDGREVTIRRKQSTSYLTDYGMREFVILSRLHHRNLVRPVGYCEKKDERLWVYEYMKKGSLYDHLHHEGSSVLNSWKMRIKIALDASRGIEYLHNYAVPSIIHRDIKSYNILLDATWTACVFDFELSLMSSEPDHEHDESLAGTVGYIDPEYVLQGVVTAKSDVYGFGVVLLELLTGKKAIIEYERSVVEFAVRAILDGDLVEILDPRVGPPDVNEAQALEFLAYTAICCVKSKGKDRPTMVDVVVNLERALAICDSSPYDENFSSHCWNFPQHLLSLSPSFWNISTDGEDRTHDSLSNDTISDVSE